MSFLSERKERNQSADKGCDNEDSLTKSSSFNVGRGMADVRPAFLFVAAMVFVFAKEKAEKRQNLFNLAQKSLQKSTKTEARLTREKYSISGLKSFL